MKLHRPQSFAVALLALCLVGAGCAAENVPSATITSAQTVPTTGGPDGDDDTAGDTSQTTAPETTAVEVIPTTTEPEYIPETTYEITNPTTVEEHITNDGPEIVYLWDGAGGTYGPADGEIAWHRGPLSDEFLGGWRFATPGPNNSMWRSALVAQTQDCATLQLDISMLTSPNALDFALSLPTNIQPNCAQEVLWPAGYNETFLVTEGGVVLLYIDQEPRDGCLIPACVPEVVTSIEFRPLDDLGTAGQKVEVSRTPMPVEETFPTLPQTILSDAPRITSASQDRGTFIISNSQAAVLVSLGSAEPLSVPVGAAASFDGEGYFFTDGPSLMFQPQVGEPKTLATFDYNGLHILADSPDYVIVNLIKAEESIMGYYNKTTGLLEITPLGGLPGVELAFIR